MTTIYIKRDFVRKFKIKEDLKFLNNIHKKQPYPNIRSGWSESQMRFTLTICGVYVIGYAPYMQEH